MIVPGIAMPFFPMRPIRGHVIRNKRDVEDFYWRNLRTEDWLIQPKLEGSRASIGILDKKVHIQNRHGAWYRRKVNNLADFAKLPNKTVLDGEVFKGDFFPFECLAIDGVSVVRATAFDRQDIAFKLVTLLGHTWKFKRPDKAWVAQLRKNEPVYGGVVLKRSGSPYIIQGAANGASRDWMKRCWA